MSLNPKKIRFHVDENDYSLYLSYGDLSVEIVYDAVEKENMLQRFDKFIEEFNEHLKSIRDEINENY
ncbi:MAG TPA: hypothetical protein V6C58_16585 [Allocoleopsis sp.]